ncbi:hypothetical protein HK096_001460, partial [Nowakowskiella sp. JEL0078]
MSKRIFQSDNSEGENPNNPENFVKADDDSAKEPTLKKSKNQNTTLALVPEKPIVSRSHHQIERPINSSQNNYCLFFAEDCIDGLVMCVGKFLRDNIELAGPHLE